MTSFTDLTTVHDGRWSVRDGWLQGRGAWGGLIVGTAVHAALACHSERAGDAALGVREISAHMLAPVPVGEWPVAVEALRVGSGTATYRVDVRDDGAPDDTVTPHVLAGCTVVMGRSRAADLAEYRDPGMSMPDAPPWPDVPEVALGEPMAPEFTQHLEFRPVSGWPYQGATDDVVSWVRFPDDSMPDAARLLGLVDALWPAALVTVTSPRPMATLTFTATLHVDPATVDPREPLLHRGHLVALDDGYAAETRTLWTPDGRLAVRNTQVLAIIR